MKKIVLALALVLGVVLAPGVSLAHDGVDHKAPIAKERSAKAPGLTQSATSTKEARREAVIEKFALRMMNHYGASVERMETLADRLEDRIDTIEDKHEVDLADARAKLATARTKLTQASTTVHTIPTEVDEILADNSGNESFAEVREFLGGVQDEVRDAHRSLVVALRSVKVSLGLEHATSTGN